MGWDWDWVWVGSLCGATIRASLCDAKNDIRDVCSIADFIDSRLSNLDFSILDISILDISILDISILEFPYSTLRYSTFDIMTIL